MNGVLAALVVPYRRPGDGRLLRQIFLGPIQRAPCRAAQGRRKSRETCYGHASRLTIADRYLLLVGRRANLIVKGTSPRARNPFVIFMRHGEAPWITGG
ncbi:hypothetical protein AGR4C_pb20139 [Agrobacterium tumefaciens str. Kerr 14]|uniref:Uncharacterized protein n=1 Tax=Agrobacterium tumefaciens str. Kerr 14 TaxID=1183424 RepID=A0A1S7SE09_AGRTU|nr:hypothetical protein AGR4C_pb20139 [Agrobacterium tumefaciens str. Kerr 14]